MTSTSVRAAAAAVSAGLLSVAAMTVLPVVLALLADVVLAIVLTRTVLPLRMHVPRPGSSV